MKNDDFKYFNQKKLVLEDRVNPQQKWNYLDKRDITEKDLDKIVSFAKKLKDPLVRKWQENVDREAEKALEMAMKILDHGKYDSKIDHNDYEKMLKKISSSSGGDKMSANVKKIAATFDQMAEKIREGVLNGHIHRRVGYVVEMLLDQASDAIESHDKIASDFEKEAAGQPAKALTTGPNHEEIEADEPYMRQFGDGDWKEGDQDESWYMNWYNDGENNELRQSNDPALDESAPAGAGYGRG